MVFSFYFSFKGHRKHPNAPVLATALLVALDRVERGSGQLRKGDMCQGAKALGGFGRFCWFYVGFEFCFALFRF